MKGAVHLTSEFRAALNFGFTTVDDFAEVDTFTDVVCFRQEGAFQFVPDRTTFLFFAGSKAFIGVLTFTEEFVMAAVYALTGVPDLTEAMAITGVLPLAD